MYLHKTKQILVFADSFSDKILGFCSPKVKLSPVLPAQREASPPAKLPSGQRLRSWLRSSPGVLSPSPLLLPNRVFYRLSTFSSTAINPPPASSVTKCRDVIPRPRLSLLRPIISPSFLLKERYLTAQPFSSSFFCLTALTLS